MSLRWLLRALFWFVMALCSTANATKLQAWGYQAYWLPDGWRSTATGQLDRILFFELKMDAKGDIIERNGWPEQWQTLRSDAKEHRVPLDLTLTLFDAATFEALFSSRRATLHLLAVAVDLARHDDVAGLHLDVEMYNRIRPATLARFQQFVRDLSDRLQQLHAPRTLSVFFPIGGASVLYDRPTLQKVTQVVVQGYDAHSSDSQFAGPVAPLGGDDEVTWIKAVAQVSALGVARDRMILGFPLFGYEWRVHDKAVRSKTIGAGVPTSFAPMPAEARSEITRHVQTGAKQRATRHDAQSGSAFYRTTDRSGHLIEGWFEDRDSLVQKIRYLNEQQLGGIAFFALGYDDGALVNYFLQHRPDTRYGLAVPP
jgi:spore germination protein